MNFTHLVGNTPMIRIRYKLDGREGFAVFFEEEGLSVEEPA